MKAKEMAEKIAALEKRVAELESKPVTERIIERHYTYYQPTQYWPINQPTWQWYPTCGFTNAGGTGALAYTTSGYSHVATTDRQLN